MKKSLLLVVITLIVTGTAIASRGSQNTPTISVVATSPALGKVAFKVIDSDARTPLVSCKVDKIEQDSEGLMSIRARCITGLGGKCSFDSSSDDFNVVVSCPGHAPFKWSSITRPSATVLVADNQLR